MIVRSRYARNRRMRHKRRKRRQHDQSRTKQKRGKEQERHLQKTGDKACDGKSRKDAMRGIPHQPEAHADADRSQTCPEQDGTDDAQQYGEMKVGNDEAAREAR